MTVDEQFDPYEVPPEPGHYYHSGCCDIPRAYHEWSPQESQEVADWLETEPGKRQRLSYRRDQLGRLRELNAPEIIIDNQLELCHQLERELGEELSL